MSSLGIFTYYQLFNFNPRQVRSLSPEVMALLEASSKLAHAFGDFADSLASVGGQSGTSPSPLCQCAPVSEPAVEDSCHPAGSLQVEGDVVTTPGGYKIEMLGQYEWKITGPDGKSTRIWGDPHVDESDRDGAADWDFKRNSTFVLPDGTHINVTTVPGGASGMTVTGKLEIINGVDRVLVTDVDKGKGQIGTVTQDGHLYLDKFKGDVIRMGRESDDWSFEGREITGSKDGGDSFELGGELHPGSIRPPARFEDGFAWAMSTLGGVFDQWMDSWRPNSFGVNPYYNNASGSGNRPEWYSEDRGRAYDRRQHFEALSEAFRALGDMFSAVARFMSLGEQLTAGRRFQHCAV